MGFKECLLLVFNVNLNQRLNMRWCNTSEKRSILWQPNQCTEPTSQPAAQMSNEIQTLWKWIECITTIASGLCASHIMTLALSWDPNLSWACNTSQSIYGLVLIVTRQSAIFNILLYSTISLFWFVDLFAMHLSISWSSQLLGHAIINTKPFKAYSFIVLPNWTWACTSCAGISASRKHISKLWEQT